MLLVTQDNDVINLPSSQLFMLRVDTTPEAKQGAMLVLIPIPSPHIDGFLQAATLYKGSHLHCKAMRERIMSSFSLGADLFSVPNMEAIHARSHD